MNRRLSMQSLLSLNPARAARCLLALAGMAFAVSAGATTGESREALGPGDGVRITVFQNPDLTTETRVSERGTVQFPLIGEVKVEGQSPYGAANRIAEQLKKGNFMKNPQVNVAVTAIRSRQVSVLGHVVRPGRYPLDDVTTSISDVLALAGGIAPTGDDTVTAMVRRDGKATKMEIDLANMYRTGDLKSNFQVQAGDTIYVQRAPVFYIYGEVTRSGSYRLEPNMAVMQAISLGGGLSPRGTDRGLVIHRRGADGSLQKIDARLSDAVRADDIIYVKESLF
jgi:polysaccharide export outer membrane protein